VNLEDDKYTEINFFNELELILRFIRNKEPYTISRWVYFSNQTIYHLDMVINL